MKTLGSLPKQGFPLFGVMTICTLIGESTHNLTLEKGSRLPGFCWLFSSLSPTHFQEAQNAGPMGLCYIRNIDLLALNVISRPAASAPHGNMVEMRFLRSYSSLPESEEFRFQNLRIHSRTSNFYFSRFSTKLVMHQIRKL